VIHPGLLAGRPLEKDELERGLGDGEVGVAGPSLGRLDVEQLRVELDRLFEIGDAQGELDAGHSGFLSGCFDVCRCRTLPRCFDGCQYGRMSKQAAVPVLEQCCAPLVRQPLDEASAVQLAAVFKALSDPVRLRLLSLIASYKEGEVCVCDLLGAFDVGQSTISHHLRVLREAGLVDCRRRGTWVYYWPLPPALHRLSSLLDAETGTPRA
jgi:ArsR family transcriptional regulator